MYAIVCVCICRAYDNIRHFPEIIATCQFTLVILDILSVVIEIPRTEYWFFQGVVGLLGVTVGFPRGNADTTNQKLSTDQSDQ